MIMTDYNDGKWHSWNGEDMKPASVHSSSVIEYVWHDENTNKSGRSERVAGYDEKDVGPAWGHILKFRVVKEHKEPREFWQYYDNQTGQWIVSSNPPEIIRGGSELIHVREVTE